MSKIRKAVMQAAAGAAGEAVYVDDVFSTYIYAGTSSENQIVNGIDLDGEGGLLWLKKRSGGATGATHSLIDTERGRLVRLQSNSNGSETSFSQLDSFNSDGFTIPSTAGELTNLSGKDYVSWTFRKQPGFFDVVTYTGDGVAGRTVSHNLGSVPGMIIVKRRDGTNDWQVYHRGIDATAPEDYYIPLNQTDARIDSDVRWNDTAPTATEFTVGSSGATNASGGTYVAYLFAHDAQDFGTDSDESIIKCGSVTYGVSGDVEVDLGWEPQWVLMKLASHTGGWWIVDNKRGWCAQKTVGTHSSSTGGNLQSLFAESTNAEAEYNYGALTTTGFKWASNFNHGTGTTKYIYVAIRRPHKPAEEFAATDLFSTALLTGTGSAQTITSGFPVDAFWNKTRGSSPVSFTKGFTTRLTKGYTDPSRTAGEVYSSSITLDVTEMNNTGVKVENNSASNINYNGDIQVNWMFRRAPGFFDVVAYTGSVASDTNLTPTSYAHNLNVAPELIIVKARSRTINWFVWHKDITSGYFLRLNLADGITTASGDNPFVSGVVQSADNFQISGVINNSGYNYITYLFATVPGISKVGSYTGTGANLDVDCGFTSGARFVLVKRTDASGSWLVWDTERGIVAGNDPYLLLNATGAEVTSNDYIDPLSSGFTITSSAPAALNASGGTYIFLAIA